MSFTAKTVQKTTQKYQTVQTLRQTNTTKQKNNPITS
jgi:hypothetical protein